MCALYVFILTRSHENVHFDKHYNEVLHGYKKMQKVN